MSTGTLGSDNGSIMRVDLSTLPARPTQLSTVGLLIFACELILLFRI